MTYSPTWSDRPTRSLASGRLVPAVLALGALAAIVAAFVHAGQGRLALLLAISAGLGLALSHSAFGFSHGFRMFLSEGRSAQVRAQFLMLAVMVLLFVPAIGAGSVFGLPVRGFVFPIGFELVIGAFLFGVGMQLGGACGSGTLYTLAGGGTRMALTFVFFIVGATLAAFTAETWQRLPEIAGVSLITTIGTLPALAVILGVLGVLFVVVTVIERSRRGSVEPLTIAAPGGFIRGPWTLGLGALVIAGLAFAALIVAGRPWGITQAFALWGSQAVDRLGLDDPTFWVYWEDPTRVDILQRSLALDTMSVMNAGIVLGAMLAASLGGRLRPTLAIGFGPAIASVIGGLLLGFGAIMATGCNISAYVSGIASGSLHGWVWLASALPGVYVGAKLRSLFGLT